MIVTFKVFGALISNVDRHDLLRFDPPGPGRGGFGGFGGGGFGFM